MNIHNLPVTPLHAIEWPDENKNHFFLKRDDLIPFSFGGNKVRIACAFLKDMKASGRDALIMYGDLRSNLCRVLAGMCYREEIPYVMIATSENSSGATPFNTKIIKGFQSKILVCKKNEIAETVDCAFDLLRSEGLKPYYIYGDRTGSGNEGTAACAYSEVIAEISDQSASENINIDYIFTPYGTGSTQGGLICGNLLSDNPIPVIGISISSRTPERAKEVLEKTVKGYFKKTERALPRGWHEMIHLETSFNCGGYGLYDSAVSETIRKMFLLNSVPMDPVYTGKAFTGMTQYIKEHHIEGRNILFLHTGGLPLFFDYLQKRNL